MHSQLKSSASTMGNAFSKAKLCINPQVQISKGSNHFDEKIFRLPPFQEITRHALGAKFQGCCYPRPNKNSCFRRQLSAVHKSASQNSHQWTYKYLDRETFGLNYLTK